MIFETKNKKIHLFGTFNNFEATINEGMRNILSLNIDSYTGGTNGIWRNAKTVLASEYSVPQDYSDGLL